MDYVQKVFELKERYNTNSPFTIAKSLGISIVHENLGNTFGYYSKHFRIKIIHINENLDEFKQTYACAHELGHAVLHPDANTSFLKRNTFYSTDLIELEANYFAISLVFIEDFQNGTISFNDALRLYGVPKNFLNLLLSR